MAKYYIVQRLGWQYNDEINYRSEDAGGKPERVFTDRKKAETLADELNAKEFSECNLGSYGYGMSEIIDDEFWNVYNKLFGTSLSSDDDEAYDFHLPKLTVEQYKKLQPHINEVLFFEIVTCEGE